MTKRARPAIGNTKLKALEIMPPGVESSAAWGEFSVCRGSKVLSTSEVTSKVSASGKPPLPWALIMVGVIKEKTPTKKAVERNRRDFFII